MVVHSTTRCPFKFRFSTSTDHLPFPLDLYTRQLPCLFLSVKEPYCSLPIYHTFSKADINRFPH